MEKCLFFSILCCVKMIGKLKDRNEKVELKNWIKKSLIKSKLN